MECIHKFLSILSFNEFIGVFSSCEGIGFTVNPPLSGIQNYFSDLYCLFSLFKVANKHLDSLKNTSFFLGRGVHKGYSIELLPGFVKFTIIVLLIKLE